jgi:hypothetical protein
MIPVSISGFGEADCAPSKRVRVAYSVPANNAPVEITPEMFQQVISQVPAETTKEILDNDQVFPNGLESILPDAKIFDLLREVEVQGYLADSEPFFNEAIQHPAYQMAARAMMGTAGPQAQQQTAPVNPGIPAVPTAG